MQRLRKSSSELVELIGNFRFEYESEYEHKFAGFTLSHHIPIFTPEDSFFTGKKHEGVKAMETSLV